MAAPALSADRPPQILPWLAHKAGVAPERARTLWRDALRDTAGAGELPGTPEFWKEAMDRLLEKTAAESLELRSAPFGLGPWLRLPAKLWLIGLNGADAVALAAARQGRRLLC